MVKIKESAGVDLYTAYPELTKEIRAIFRTIIKYGKDEKSWADLENVINDLIEKTRYELHKSLSKK